MGKQFLLIFTNFLNKCGKNFTNIQKMTEKNNCHVSTAVQFKIVNIILWFPWRI